jgi:hypothetical protein
MNKKSLVDDHVQGQTHAFFTHRTGALISYLISSEQVYEIR